MLTHIKRLLKKNTQPLTHFTFNLKYYLFYMAAASTFSLSHRLSKEAISLLLAHLVFKRPHKARIMRLYGVKQEVPYFVRFF